MLQARLTSSRSTALSAAGAAAFLGLWSAAALSGMTSRDFLPAPWDVATRFAHLVAEPFAGYTLLQHLLSSFQRFATGFVLAVLVGIPLGLLMAWFRWIDRIVSPAFDAVRFVAPIAWVPFAGLWFGTGIGGPTLIIFSGAFPPCLINAYRGAKYVDRRLVEAARTLGASGPRVVLEVLLPASLPSIVAGLRVAAGIGWQSLVGAELIVVASGVGYMMVQAQLSVVTPIVMAGMVAIGLVGVVIDAVLRGAEERIKRSWGR